MSWLLPDRIRETMKILYHAINGTGLGHAVRLTAIATELASLEPDAHQLIVTNAQVSEPFRRSGLPYLILPAIRGGPGGRIDRRCATIPSRTGIRLLYHTITEYQPDAVVFDTHYSVRLVTRLREIAGLRLVLVLRSCRASYLQEQLNGGGLALFDRLLVPHDRDELERDLSGPLVQALAALPALSFLGPIVRRRSGADRRAAAGDEILVTCGAGGYRDSARRFLQRATAAALAVAERYPETTVTVVSGPYCGPLSLPSGCRQHSWLADLDERIHGARLVISHAGYNTVNEILSSSAAALLVPLPRLEGPDRPVAADLPSFVEELVAALDRTLAKNTPAPDARRLHHFTWAAVYERVVSVWLSVCGPAG